MKKKEWLKMTTEQKTEEDKKVRAEGCKRIEDDIENGDMIISRYDTEMTDWRKGKSLLKEIKICEK